MALQECRTITDRVMMTGINNKTEDSAMKKTMKFLTMTALALTGAVMTGCSNDDDWQQPKDNVVTLTTTVSISGGEAGARATTRALTTDGVKTFAKGEKIAVIYTNTNDETVKTVSDELPDGDYGKTATFTVTLTNPKAGGDVRYIYPAAMAATTVATTTPVDDDATVNYAALHTQDGTMASLSANLDFAKFDGSLTDSAGLPASPTLVNQLAICEFTIKNAAGTDITSTLTDMTPSTSAEHTLAATMTTPGMKVKVNYNYSSNIRQWACFIPRKNRIFIR